jgi:hypothetical protein
LPLWVHIISEIKREQNKNYIIPDVSKLNRVHPAELERKETAAARRVVDQILVCKNNQVCRD